MPAAKWIFIIETPLLKDCSFADSEWRPLSESPLVLPASLTDECFVRTGRGGFAEETPLIFATKKEIPLPAASRVGTCSKELSGNLCFDHNVVNFLIDNICFKRILTLDQTRF